MTLLLATLAGCASFSNPRGTSTDYETIRRKLNYAGREDEDLERQLDSNNDSAASFTVESIGDFADNVDKTIRGWTGGNPNPDKAREIFAKAEQGFQDAQQIKDEKQRKQRYIELGNYYALAAKYWPDSAIEHKALYKAGTCFFWADHYAKSNEIYELMLKQYPNSRFLDTVEAHRFSIAQYWLKYNTASPQSYWAVNFTDDRFPMTDLRGQAIKIFDLIRLDDPTGKLADDATLAAANAYFEVGSYLKADEYYTDLRRTFPSSEHQFSAHFLGMKAKLKSYQGPEYSAAPLKGAEELAIQIRKQFPGKASKHREALASALAEIRREKARRAWNLAQYYERRWQYGASKHYYRQLTSQFPNTPMGNRAEARLRTLAGKPDNPSQPLPWLVNLFPDSQVAKPILATAPASTTLR